MVNNNPHIVFFDGFCILCKGSVDFLLTLDKHHLLRFAPLQGSTAKEMLPPEIRKDVDSVVYYKEGQTWLRSAAFMEICRDLGGWLHIFRLGVLFPRALRDRIYNLIARNRYRWFGRRESCRLPEEEERPYFLD